jgi:hypothetical protein
MTTPTTETMIAAVPVPLVFPDWNSATMPRMNAMGSITHPTISAPLMQAKTSPMMLTTRAISPRAFFCLIGA